MTASLVRGVCVLLLLLIGGALLPDGTAAQTDRRCFPETGFCIGGAIRDYWEQQGGLPIFGYPISPQQREYVEGSLREVQWFERNRLELHPDNAPPYHVLSGRLSVERLHQQGRAWEAFPRSEPRPDCRYFPETGHNLCGDILAAWRASGLEFDGQPGTSEPESLALFGLPLSDAQPETLSDGQTYIVQWFERARLELHPDNAPPYHVLSGLIGRAVYDNQTITADTTLLAAPRASAAQACDYIITRGTIYPPEDVCRIVSYYWTIAPAVGVDPLLAIAQNLHETDNLKSWWAQRPRRNGSGYGVTGETSSAPPPPAEAHAWAYDEAAQLWRKGLSFATWEQSVRAQVGRLLAYALPPGQATPAQQLLIDEALALRSLPAGYRGIAPTLRGLNGRWAYPGTTYAERVAEFANAIRRHP